MRKQQLLIGVITLCLLISACSIKTIPSSVTNESTNKTEDVITSPSKATNINSSNETTPTVTGKSELSMLDMLWYSGYMDTVDENWFGTRYIVSDYDNDGLTDRVYRQANKVLGPNSVSNGTWPDTVSFRIDFANGDNLDVGTFDDVFLGVKIIGADLTGDGNNEIIFLGHHDAMTDPSYSEIAVFQKNNTKYERIRLPIPDNEALNSDYIIGYPVYAKNDTGNDITLYADYASYEETIHINKTDYNRNERYIDDDIISYIAWGIGTEKFDDKIGLVLYQRIGGRNYYNNALKITLLWQDNEFKPAKIDVVDHQYDW